MRKILLLIAILILGMEASAYAQALDAPHNQTNALVCADCHNFGNTPVDDACLSCHINDTGAGYSKNSAPKMLTHSSATTSAKYGTWTQLCKDCHQPHSQNQREIYLSQTYLATGTVTAVSRNTTLNTTTYTYNNLNVLNASWSDPATWGRKSANRANGNERGLIIYPNTASFGLSAEIISATGTSITVHGFPGTVAVGSSFALVYGQHMSTSIKSATGSHPDRFFTNSGPNSFAYDESGTGIDPNPDGVCQVCHTQTQQFRADGTRAAVGSHLGNNGVNCITCHKHEDGFAASCTTCHGFPPIESVANQASTGQRNGLVDSPAPTGSTIAGAHNKHANTLGLDCIDCHYNSKGNGPTHNDGTIQAVTMGFYLFGGAVQGGKYDGQTGVDYNTTVTSPVTTVSNTGTRQCSNIYCHSIGQATNGGPLVANTANYKTPIWNGTVVCGDCHKSDGTQGTGTFMDSGSHLTHVNSTNLKSCSECHNGAGAGTGSHANNLIEVAFTTDPFANTPAYSQSPNTPGNGYGTCSTVYCHSIGQRSGGTALVAGTADYKAPSWGGTAGCGSCHATVMSSASHTAHLDAPFLYDCLVCHNGAGAGTTKHTDKNIDIAFSALSGGTGTYSQSPNPPGNGYGTCSTTNCHGTTSPQWGTNFVGIDRCTKCHGTPTVGAAPEYAKAPPSDTAGNTLGTDKEVGAHQAHLRATNNISSPIACSECHIIPTLITSAGHIDSSLPAELTFGTLAKVNGLTPLYNYGSGQCATTYCHGNAMPRGTTDGTNKAPTWSDANYLNGDPAHNCSQCHGYPPAGIAAHVGAGPTSCINCHSEVNAAGTGFTDPSKHVNGVLDGGFDNCTNCHTNASLSASHLKHTNPDVILAGKALSASDFGNVSWWYTSSNTGGVPYMGCGYCHPNTPSSHMNGVRDLNFEPNEAGLPAGTLKGLNGLPAVFTQSAGVSVTCASVYCHSNGYNDGTGYVYQPSPDWYGGAFVGDKCSNCHGNSPNSGGKPGSLSHYNPDAMGMGIVGGHFVGIHYNNVYTGTSGVIKDAGNRQNAHGDPLTSTTINCQSCHNATVSVSVNDLNSVCATCHAGATAKGVMQIAAAATTHVDGKPDVSFAPTVVNSKAQIRDNITAVPELNNSWTRNNGYKAISSYDGSKTPASYDAGTKSCSSIACHNGNAVQWGAPNVTCTSCHTSLP